MMKSKGEEFSIGEKGVFRNLSSTGKGPTPEGTVIRHFS